MILSRTLFLSVFFSIGQVFSQQNNPLDSIKKSNPAAKNAVLNEQTKIPAIPAGEATRTIAIINQEISLETPVTIANKYGELAIYLKAGCYNFKKNDLSTDLLRVWVNDTEPLRGARIIKQTPTQLIVENTINGLQTQLIFNVSTNGELTIKPILHNQSNTAIPLRQLITARGSYRKTFSENNLDSLKFFREDFFIWGGENPGHYRLQNKTIQSFYLGILFAPNKNKALTLAYNPNILWSSCVQANGKNQTIMAYTEFGKNPFNMTPGRKEAFDELVISFDKGLVNALLNYGTKFKPHQAINRKNMVANNGWNSWEYFKGSINEDTLKYVLDTMSLLQKTTGLFNSIVIDGGYSRYFGKWEGDPKKFPNGMGNSAKVIKKYNFKPGIWLTPSFVSPEIVKETGLPSFAHPFNKSNPVRIFDPSDKKSNDYFLKQIGSFADAGYSYFKTDFLGTAYRIDRDYGSSDYAPERVLREYYQKIRNTIGQNTYWLACGSVPIPLVGLVDASRIGPDVAANWERSRNGIETKLIPRFWMHGNLFWADGDFLVVAGEGYTKKNQPIHGVVASKTTDKASGYTKDEAKTWCNFLIITGGMLTWSDNPATISEEGLDVVKRAFKHGTGNMGIPLDYENTSMPVKWVRTEKDRIYIGLFNWGNTANKVVVDSKAIPELRNAKSGVDVLTNQIFEVVSERIEVSLQPRSSVCIEIKK